MIGFKGVGVAALAVFCTDVTGPDNVQQRGLVASGTSCLAVALVRGWAVISACPYAVARPATPQAARRLARRTNGYGPRAPLLCFRLERCRYSTPRVTWPLTHAIQRETESYPYAPDNRVVARARLVAPSGESKP